MRGPKFLPSLVLAVSALAAMGAVGGCAENRSSFYIAYAAAPTADEEGCKVDLTGDPRAFSSGLMDLLVTKSFTTTPVFANQLTPREDFRVLKTETSTILIEGAEITVSALDGGTVNNGSYSIPFSGIVYPESQTAIVLTAVPAGVIREEGQYLIQIQAFGHTTGGTAIETPAWAFPLEVCEGCLIRCPADPTKSERLTAPCDLGGSNYAVDARDFGGTCG